MTTHGRNELAEDVLRLRSGVDTSRPPWYTSGEEQAPAGRTPADVPGAGTRSLSPAKRTGRRLAPPGRQVAMAKAIGPAHSDDARGKHGSNMVYSGWRGIHVVRAYRAPTNPRSAKQSAVRSQIADLSRAWRSLTSTQRDGWKAYAQAHPYTDPWSGQSYTLPGFNMYVALNRVLKDMGVAVISDAPSDPGPAQLESVTPSCVAHQISIAYTASPLGAGLMLDVWGFRSKSAGRTPGPSEFFRLGHSAAAAASPYAPGFGEAGDYITVATRVVDTATGLCSAFVVHDAVEMT